MSFNKIAIQMNTLVELVVELVDDRIFPHCTHFSLTSQSSIFDILDAATQLVATLVKNLPDAPDTCTVWNKSHKSGGQQVCNQVTLTMKVAAAGSGEIMPVYRCWRSPTSGLPIFAAWNTP
jgi:hypothetical protein